MKLLLWILKKINHPWYWRYLAEDALEAYGLKPVTKNSWAYINENKQLMVNVGLWLKSEDTKQWRFYCRMHVVYGNYLRAYLPLKEGYTYTPEKIIELLKPKTSTTT